MSRDTGAGPDEFRWKQTADYRKLKRIADLDGDTPCYIPGIGETTVRDVKLAARGDVYLDALAESLDEALNYADERRRDRWAGADPLDNGDLTA